MASSLNLSLPEAPRPRRSGRLVQWLTLAVAVAALVLIIVERKPAPSGQAARPAAPEPDRLKRLATDLEKRTLYIQAAEVWDEYLAAASPTNEERAEILYRRGKCLKEGGQAAEAARALSEVEGFASSRDEKRKAWQLLIECLDALGKRDARESVARSFATGAEEKGTAVARVGSDVITREEIRDDLKAAILDMLRAQGTPATPAELDAKAAEVADSELKSPEGSSRAIQQAVSRHVLYREGLERGFAEDAAVQSAIARFRREYIASRVVEAEVENAMKALGPTELQNHYEAHKDRFVEKAGAEFSFARFPGAAEAEAAIEKLGDPARASQVQLEKPSGFAVAGEPVPGIGLAPELTAHILALNEGDVSKKPVEHEATYYVFRVEKRRPDRQLSAKEAEPLVRADLAALKRKDALEALRGNLSQKFSVQLVDDKGPADAKSTEAKKGTASPASPSDPPGSAPQVPSPSAGGSAGSSPTQKP